MNEKTKRIEKYLEFLERNAKDRRPLPKKCVRCEGS